MIRLFAACDLSKEAKTEIMKLIEEFEKKRWPVKWESCEKLHITLFFIGWISEDKLDLVKKGVQAAALGVEPFSIRMGNLGVFPDFVQPRVVWLGIKGDQQDLVKLRRRVAEEMIDLGFKDQKRGWIPHLTIGRFGKEARFKQKREIGRQLRKLELEEMVAVSKIDRVVIYESKLRPFGSEYRNLGEYLLD